MKDVAKKIQEKIDKENEEAILKDGVSYMKQLEDTSHAVQDAENTFKKYKKRFKDKKKAYDQFIKDVEDGKWDKEKDYLELDDDEDYDEDEKFETGDRRTYFYNLMGGKAEFTTNVSTTTDVPF